MKQILCILLIMAIVCVLCFALAGCGNQQLIDTTWTFERAIIFLPNGEKIEGPITRWNDYSESDMVQVQIEDKTYLTHSSNVIMISE